MPVKEKRDDIDLELSRTYFGHISKDSQTKGSVKKETILERLKNTKIPVLDIVVIVLLSLFVLSVVYFLTHNHVSFSLNINVTPPKTLNKASLETKKPRLKAPPIGTMLPAILGELSKLRPPAQIYTFTKEKTLYDFEGTDEGWAIPVWAYDKPDHVATFFRNIKGIASHGNGSIELYAEFPGGKWSAAIAWIQQYLDISGYDTILVDVFLPPNAPAGIRGKIILTVSEDWRFIEMIRGTKLEPGRWTTVAGDLSEKSNDWKRTVMNKTFKADVRNIAVRIESNKKTPYSGPIYIDNVRIAKREK